MAVVVADMSLKMAREVLGVSSLSTPEEVRAAYREAAKRAHPDGGGDEAAFRQVTQAYERLQNPEDRPAAEPNAGPSTRTLEICPALALNGGLVEHRVDGRNIRITVPAGLRSGDKVRAAGRVFSIYVRAEDGVLVRGDDLWITLKVHPATLRKGGRVRLDTPLGPRTVWIDARAAERGLVRLEGEGLPACGRHARGDLFLRLAAAAGPAESAALNLLRRFTAAWAV
jgi:curved DNA-binding protein